MSARTRIALAAALLTGAALLGGAGDPGCPPGVRAAQDWKRIATAHDRDRLQHWRETWVAAVTKAQAARPAEVAAAGVLLDPDAGLAGPAIPPGDYRCRTLKIGGKGPGMPDYLDMGAVPCRVSAGDGGQATERPDRLTVREGVQRPGGRLFPDGNGRLVFLGTIELADERTRLLYGRDTQRDLGGLVERIASNRWRLALPDPAWQSMLDVVEITPAG